METKLTLHGEILGVRNFFETKYTLSHNKKKISICHKDVP
jgi:hypothetical protein